MYQLMFHALVSILILNRTPNWDTTSDTLPATIASRSLGSKGHISTPRRARQPRDSQVGAHVPLICPTDKTAAQVSGQLPDLTGNDTA
jgi:hypothetical protein